MIRRAEKRRAADFWPIRLRERLPVIPIPLRPRDRGAPVDRQEVLHRTYDGPGYERCTYNGEPEPSLSPDDAARGAGAAMTATPHRPTRRRAITAIPLRDW